MRLPTKICMSLYISFIEIALLELISIAAFETRFYHHHEDESQINLKNKPLSPNGSSGHILRVCFLTSSNPTSYPKFKNCI